MPSQYVNYLNTDRHPITDPDYVAECRGQLDQDGALVLHGFVGPDTIAQIVETFASLEADAYYANETHNVYLTPSDPSLADDHTYNRQIISSKGLIADDHIPAASPLRIIYNDQSFQSFLCGVLGIESIHAYDDDLSSINVHFAPEGKELGWHFDNSSFAITMLLQAPDAGGNFDYVPAARDSSSGDMGYDLVGRVLDGSQPFRSLKFAPGDLVLFRGRDAMHRVTPTEGSTTRLLVVFAFNDAPGVALSRSALQTFYGRTS